MPMPETVRCPWCGVDPLYTHYHDTEWGVPERDDRALFEKLILDGFQAGLSWITILRKRDNFRKAFDGFVPEKIVRYRQPKLDRLMLDAGIVRNKAKIEGTVQNARAWLKIMETGGEGAFSRMMWDVVEGEPQVNRWKSTKQVPAETEASRKLSKQLKQAGFTFCGPTIVYAVMQATGLVNDHILTCHRHPDMLAR